MITGETITDSQIWDYRDSLPREHFMVGVCADALGSPNHPLRRRNCRAMVADAINRNEVVK